jgi:hypothetical protein
MRRKRVYTDYLRDIAHYAAKVEQFVAGLGHEQFAADGTPNGYWKAGFATLDDAMTYAQDTRKRRVRTCSSCLRSHSVRRTRPIGSRRSGSTPMPISTPGEPLAFPERVSRT